MNYWGDYVAVLSITRSSMRAMESVATLGNLRDKHLAFPCVLSYTQQGEESVTYCTTILSLQGVIDD